MNTNILILTINVPDSICLKRINNTFALKSLFHTPLHVGLNTYHANHANYANIARMQCGLFEITSKEVKTPNL
jgi:hypothetical protein